MYKYNTMNTQDFNIVHITDFYERDKIYLCNNEDGYKCHLKSNPAMVENIGKYGQQIKPIFDVDAYEVNPNIDEIFADIHKKFPDKPIMLIESQENIKEK